MRAQYAWVRQLIPHAIADAARRFSISGTYGVCGRTCMPDKYTIYTARCVCDAGRRRLELDGLALGGGGVVLAHLVPVDHVVERRDVPGQMGERVRLVGIASRGISEGHLGGSSAHSGRRFWYLR